MTETFGPSPGKVIALTAVTGFLAWAALDDYRTLKHNRHEVVIEMALACLAAIALAWLLSLRLTLSDDSIRYKSLFRTQVVRWLHVREIYYTKSRRTAFLVIPLWQTCRFVLVTGTGGRLVFGSRFRRASFAGDKTILATAQHLYNKAAERFNRGHDVSFGPVRVSQKGVWTDGWKAGTYPWAEVEGVESVAGGLLLKLSDGRAAGGRGLFFVANLHVLVQVVMMVVALAKKGERLELPIFTMGATMTPQRSETGS